MRKIIDTHLLTTRSEQIIQIDVSTGHRMGIRRNVRDIYQQRGVTYGTVSIEFLDYLVRQVGRSNEWYFCDQDGKRIIRSFPKFDAEWITTAAKFHRRHHATSSED